MDALTSTQRHDGGIEFKASGAEPQQFGRAGGQHLLRSGARWCRQTRPREQILESDHGLFDRPELVADASLFHEQSLRVHTASKNVKFILVCIGVHGAEYQRHSNGLGVHDVRVRGKAQTA
ncbi:MAG: hypothetical protein WC684_05225 [Hyphomicrobium sp.]|jgi:hypothetical protein